MKNIQDVLASLGVQDVGQIPNANIRSYGYTANFANSIAAGASTEVLTLIENDWVFVIQEICATIKIVNALSSAVAGTPVATQSGDSSGGNTMPSLSHFRVQIKTTSGDQYDQPAYLGAIASVPGAQRFRIKPIVCAPGSNVTTKLFNDSAVAVFGQLTYEGVRLNKNAVY